MKKLILLFFALFILFPVITCVAQVDDGFHLPFLEEWNNGTFETNNWLTEGENWSINWQEGTPSPSAEFTWDPIQNDYQVALESYPLLADSLTEGDIYLDFDIKLDNYQPTGTEEMLVQVWNLDSLEWVTVSTYSNADGSFDWMSEHLNITDEAMGKVFKIRFLATGEYSLRILSWFVDNIHVHRECKAPYNLTVEAINNQNEIGFLLEWEIPGTSNSGWLEWDDGENDGNSIGTGQEVEFDAAVRWNPSMLSEYNGSEIEQVAFFPDESQAEYSIRVWVGQNANNLVVDQLVDNPIIGQWNYINLTTSLMIDITQDLWVGYHVNAQTGYPAGVDSGPAIDGFGNMMNFGGWQTLLEINPELDYNWNIKVFVRGENNDTVTKYAIYRSNDGYPYFLRDYSEEERYLDETDLCEYSSLVCFYVTAIYASETDSCESGFSNEACEFCEAISSEEESRSSLNIYPNPASDVLFIESSEEINYISIFNGKGEEVRRRSEEEEKGGRGEKGKALISVKGLAPGLYLVRVETGSGVMARKMLKNR